MKSTIILFLILSSAFILFSQENKMIMEDKANWHAAYVDILPKDTAFDWYLPFKTNDRTNRNTLVIVSTHSAHQETHFTEGIFIQDWIVCHVMQWNQLMFMQ